MSKEDKKRCRLRPSGGKECNEWFLKTTKTEKIYCTNKCASRHIVRRKRKEEKQANRQ